MHLQSSKILRGGIGVLTVCLGLPFLAQAGSSSNYRDYNYRADADQREWSNGRRGYDYSGDPYAIERDYYTKQYGDPDTREDQYYEPSDRSGGTWTDGGYRSNASSALRNRSRSDYSRSDANIERNITRNLGEDSRNVQVDVRNGVVILTGTVRDREEMRAAIENAYDGGAQQVVNHMEVARLGDRRVGRMGDTGLARAVQNELAKNRNVNNDRIWVTAHEGTVILEGTVEDRSEMVAAVEDAYDAGARRVDNRLRIVN